jgi:hypothetical protein
MVQQNRIGRAGRVTRTRRIATAAAAASVGLALLFFASAPRSAQAIDLSPGGTDASLVFNPSFLGLNQVETSNNQAVGRLNSAGAREMQ